MRYVRVRPAELSKKARIKPEQVKSQRDLNVDLVANKSALAVQNQQFVALVPGRSRASKP